MKPKIPLEEQIKRLRKVCRDFIKAEWMVTCDWTSSDNRNKLINNIKRELRICNGK